MMTSTLQTARRMTIEQVRSFLQVRGNTKKALAEAAKLHPNTLQGVEDANWNPSYDTLLALEPLVAAHVERAA